MSNWKPYDGHCEGLEYFLIRMKGIHPGRGKPYTPVVAQILDGQLYILDNELKPLSWANFDDEGFCYEEKNPFKANLEWHPIPE